MYQFQLLLVIEQATS